MTHPIYIKLREQIDQYSVGFPKAASGVDLKILKKLYTEEEAELFLDLSMQLESPDSVSNRTNRDLKKTTDMLEAMAQNGLVFRKRKKNAVYYAAIPFVIGSFEFQLKRMDKDFARMVDEYFTESFFNNMGGDHPAAQNHPRQTIG